VSQVLGTRIPVARPLPDEVAEREEQKKL
jgi:hypothetical protein